jgi:HAD superfamily hydrolase (TIGR01459 family)
VGDVAGILCDVWGVVHNGRAAYPAALDALLQARAGGVPVVLLSNTPRPRPPILRQLQRFGVIEGRHFDALVTAGDAAQAALRALPPTAKFFHIGVPRDQPLFDGVSLAEAADLAAADVLVVTGLYDEERESVEDYRALLTPAAARGVPFLCANPDLVVHRGEQVLVCAGALAAFYETLGGPVRYFGKPHPAVYDLAMAALAGQVGRVLAAKEVLAIGDGLATDIAGAAAYGLPSLLIKDGIHRDELPDNGDLAAALAARGLPVPHWVMNTLAW